MFKKIMFQSLILLIVVTGEVFADPQAQLDQAMNYVSESKFDQAKVIYDSLLADPTDKKSEILASGGLILIDIYKGNNAISKTSANQLIADNSTNKIVSSAAFDIGYAFFNIGEPNEAKRYYQYIVDKWPNSEDAVLAKLGLIQCDISLGNNQKADNSLSKLLNSLPVEEEFSAPLTDTGGTYLDAGRYDSAQQLYQNVIDKWPESEDALAAYGGVGFCQAANGNDSQAMATLGFMLEEFSGHPSLGEEALSIGEPYYNEGFKLKAEGQSEKARIFFLAALKIADTVKTLDSKSIETLDAYNWMGACYYELGEYVKALECYKNAAEKYPDNPLTWHALFKVGQIYEKLKQTESINTSEYDIKIRQTYTHLLEKYPDCKAAKAVHSWLNHYNSE
ncbi:MAG: tetratricopeptide repeat protein [Planctomycetota bacterium]|jgi:TolA-binding protein